MCACSCPVALVVHAADAPDVRPGHEFAAGSECPALPRFMVAIVLPPGRGGKVLRGCFASLHSPRHQHTHAHANCARACHPASLALRRDESGFVTHVAADTAATAPSLGNTFARANATPPSRRNRGKMKISAPGPAGSYGRWGHYGNTFARANRRAGGKYGGRALRARLRSA